MMRRTSLRLLTWSSLTIFAITLSISLASFSTETQSEPEEKLHQLYANQLSELETRGKDFANHCTQVGASQDKLQLEFIQLRKAYRKVEPLSAYFEPQFISDFINGAPLPHVLPNLPELQVADPEGFQVLDEILFAHEFDMDEAKTYSKQLAHNLEVLNGNKVSKVYDYQFFEALRHHIIRMMSVHSTGFDTPSSLNGPNELRAGLENIQLQLSYFAPYCRTQEAKQSFSSLEDALKSTLTFLGKDPIDFVSFDRYTFVKEHLNKLFERTLTLQNALTVPTPDLIFSFKKPLNYEATNLFANDLLDPQYYIDQRPGDDYSNATSLGKLLFFDPALSGNGKRACASCHIPELAFTDGLPTSAAFDGKHNVDRNSPSLINSVYAERFFWDLRAQKMEFQMEHVVLNSKEFNTSFSELIHKLEESDEYVALFKKAFPSRTINKNTISEALTSYIASLTALDSRFDKTMRGEENSLTEEEQLGFNLFMGKGQCGVCHFAPTFSGLIPPQFKHSESEVLGVPTEPVTENATIDDDLGRLTSGVVREAAPFYAHAFKTMTVRNSSLTAPYMHNGVYESLEQVVDFYNRGGGVGIGADVPNQTLPFDNLNLTDTEQAAIIAFIKSLEDAPKNAEAPEKLPTFANHPEWEGRTIGGEY